MDIYILRDGSEIGPFSAETTQTMLREGSIREVDYAWHPGLPKWIPLSDVLSAAPLALETPPPPPPSAVGTPLPTFSPAAAAVSAHLPKAGESATEKQKALLGYLGIAHSSELSKDHAALLVNDAMEDAKNAPRLAQWNTDRLKLHPDLFAAEIQARKESRANDFHEICQAEGAEYFTKITKAHCQVLVGYLDVKFPNWDKDEKDAASKYFYPAVAEKFPQLVAKPWQGKLRYATGPKIAAELSRQRPPTAQLRKRKSASPVAAIARGLVYGLLILGMFYFVQKMLTGAGATAPVPSESAAEKQASEGVPQTSDAAKIESISPTAPEHVVAQADAGATMTEPTTGAPTALPADPLMAANADVPVNPGATFPSDPPMATMPADPSMEAGQPAAAPKSIPLPGFPPDPPATGGSLFGDPLTPPAAVPGASAPVAVPAPPPTVADAAAVPAKVNLKLTKPFEVQLAYGKMKLPVGTPVKLVSREGNSLKVNYLNTVLTLPATFTDIGDAAPAPVVAPPVPAAPVVPVPVPPPAAPTPPSDL